MLYLTPKLYNFDDVVFYSLNDMKIVVMVIFVIAKLRYRIDKKLWYSMYISHQVINQEKTLQTTKNEASFQLKIMRSSDFCILDFCG